LEERFEGRAGGSRFRLQLDSNPVGEKKLKICCPGLDKILRVEFTVVEIGSISAAETRSLAFCALIAIACLKRESDVRTSRTAQPKKQKT
jgi:hypothetical protein